MPDMTPMGHDHLPSMKTEVFELSDKSLNLFLKRASRSAIDHELAVTKVDQPWRRGPQACHGPWRFWVLCGCQGLLRPLHRAPQRGQSGASVLSVAASLKPQVEKPLPLAESTVLYGGQGRNRTTDTRIFNSLAGELVGVEVC
jgi:hypothetical protein